MCSRFLSLLILSILFFTTTSTTQKSQPARDAWDPSSKALLEGIKQSTKHKLDCITWRIDKMTKRATRNGVVKFSRRKKEIFGELQFRATQLKSALDEIKQMEESKDFTFSLEESTDRVVNQEFPHKNNLRHILIKVKKGDTAHAVHEILHGYQALNRDVIYVVENDTVVSHVGNGIQSNIDLEVASYKRQYAFSGYLIGFQTAPPETKSGQTNWSLLEGTKGQINRKYYIRRHKQITPEFVRSLQKEAIGDDPVY